MSTHHLNGSPAARHVAPTCGGAAAADSAPLLLDYREAARLLAVSERTVWSLVAKGELPAVRIGRAVRIDRRDLVAWVDRQKSAGGGQP